MCNTKTGNENDASTTPNVKSKEASNGDWRGDTTYVTKSGAATIRQSKAQKSMKKCRLGSGTYTLRSFDKKPIKNRKAYRKAATKARVLSNFMYIGSKAS